LRDAGPSGYAAGVEGDDERELRRYRKLCLLVGAVYLVWWAAVEAMLPRAYNPLLGRLVVVVACWAVVGASYASAWVRRNIVLLWQASLWLLTAHYFYLFYENAGGIDWVVGSFITVTAVTLGMLSRRALLAYSAFTAALAIAVLVQLPALRHSVFVPGLLTVLLQANIGLHSRLGVLRDLTISKAHFELLFESTFEGVVIHVGGRIVQVNAAFVRVLGYERAELIGRDVRTIVHPDDLQLARDALAAGGESALELRCLRKDGTAVDLELRGKPFGREATSRQRLVTVEDVSERKRRAAELRRTNEALARSNLELQRFAHIASHDLQTPLRSIASFVDLLRSTYGGQLDARATDWLARVGGSVDQLQALIRDLLDYARIDTESRPFGTVAMSEAFERATGLLDAAIREAGATVTADPLPEVTGDRSELVQLLLNLLGNAIKYRGEAPPVVHVSVEERANEWLFTVRDNGIGIAPKHHQQIFEIFKRLHDQKQYPGTGIGLAIGRRVIDRHGGKIWVESEPGRGSAFFFTLAKRPGEPR
jgi:PAS domain S-box-containing protein